MQRGGKEGGLKGEDYFCGITMLFVCDFYRVIVDNGVFFWSIRKILKNNIISCHLFRVGCCVIIKISKNELQG